MATRRSGEMIGGTSKRGAHQRAVSMGAWSSSGDSVLIGRSGCRGRGWKGRRGAPGRGEDQGGDGWAEWWMEEAGVGEVLMAEEGSRCRLKRFTWTCGGLTCRRKRAQGWWVTNRISAEDSWHSGSQWRRSEDRGVAMKEQRQGERRGREGGLRLSVAATGDNDRVVRRMGYAWRPGGQVAWAVQRELPLGDECGHDRRYVRTRARQGRLERFDCSTGPAQFGAQCFSNYVKTTQIL
jgi:hypothetical protein